MEKRLLSSSHPAGDTASAYDPKEGQQKKKKKIKEFLPLEKRSHEPGPPTPSLAGRCLRSFCPAERKYHLRLAGPSLGGKTSFIRYLLHGEGDNDVQPTDGRWGESI